MRYLTPLLLLTSMALPALAQPMVREEPRTISSTGEAVVFVVPDEVVINFGVETFDANLDKSKSSNDKFAAALVQAVKDLKVEPKHISTDVMTVDIRYRSSTPLILEGYVCRRAYSVKLRDVTLFEKFIDTILKNGANQLHGFDFRSTELRKHRDQARKMAIIAAKEKANDLAKELECRVGKPRTIAEGYSGGYGGSFNRMNSFGNAQVQVQGEAVAGAGNDDTLPLGQIAIRASVSVTFDLETGGK